MLQEISHMVYLSLLVRKMIENNGIQIKMACNEIWVLGFSNRNEMAMMYMGITMMYMGITMSIDILYIHTWQVHLALRHSPYLQ